jgi:hypothetical protein
LITAALLPIASTIIPGDVTIVVKTVIVLHVGMIAIAIAHRDMVLADADVTPEHVIGAPILKIMNALDAVAAAVMRTTKIARAIAVVTAVG